MGKILSIDLDIWAKLYDIFSVVFDLIMEAIRDPFYMLRVYEPNSKKCSLYV